MKILFIIFLASFTQNQERILHYFNLYNDNNCDSIVRIEYSYNNSSKIKTITIEKYRNNLLTEKKVLIQKNGKY